MSNLKNLNRFSKIITQEKSQGASQAMLYALNGSLKTFMMINGIS